MTIVHRRSRPIQRLDGTLRDDKLFIVGCDDTYAPKQYFDFIKLSRVQVHIISAIPGQHTARHVLDKLLTYDHKPEDERWLLLDTDHYIQGTHMKEFSNTLSEAKRQGVNIAISRPCFELWLLLHHIEANIIATFSDAQEVEKALSVAIDGYNKTNLNPKKFPLQSIADAYRKAKEVDKGVAGGVIPNANTTRVYQLFEAIISSAAPQQLPEELRVIHGMLGSI